MTIINMYQAKTHLSTLVNQTLEGQQVVIARAGKPLVRLVPYQEIKTPRIFGLFKDEMKIPDNFNDESTEINALFYGKNQPEINK